MASKHLSVPAWAIAIVVLFSCACYGDPPFSYDAKTIEKLRANYSFDKWPGKDLPAKSDLSADQITEVLRSWLKASKRPAEKLTVELEGRGFDVYLTDHGVLTRRHYAVRQFPVSVIIYWAEQSAGAHEILMGIMSMPNVIGIDDKPHPPGDQVGNLCYSHAPGVQFGFIRNNILILLQMDPDLATLDKDLLTLATALDAAIVANPLLAKPPDEALRWCETVQAAPARLRVGETVRITAGKVPKGATWAVGQRGGPFHIAYVADASGARIAVAGQSGSHDLAAVLLRAGTGEVWAKHELRVNVIDAPEK